VSRHATEPLYGERRKVKYDLVGLDKVVGQTVEAVELTAVDGAYGPEPCVMLYFKNQTKHGFVVKDD
jgi:hypothetical protein